MHVVSVSAVAAKQWRKEGKMNYRHLFHAGNFSDVFRHTLVISLIKALQNKDKAFSYIDIHAGAGNYDLTSNSAQKTEEYKIGIGRLWSQKVNHPILQLYLQLVASSQPNQSHSLQNYPGSPWYVSQLVSPADHLVLCELHREVYAELKYLFHANKQISVHHRNGYEALKALLPPKERRGLVLIDPPFEKPTEFDDIIGNLKIAYARWPQGIYAIWYPIKDNKKVNTFKNNLLNIPFKQILEWSFQFAKGG